jgi:hypothetical protein
MGEKKKTHKNFFLISHVLLKEREKSLRWLQEKKSDDFFLHHSHLLPLFTLS